tara:strand:+ start:2564 stop:4555 length:1992 start_codon:yes stop_codon:yes gene_type:complete
MKNKLLNLISSESALTPLEISTYNAENGKFTNAFVINMTSRTERLATSLFNLDKVGISPTRFSAINGSELNETDPSWTQRFPLLRPGELGCLLSHLSIAALASDHSEQDAFTLIFEDDVVTSTEDITDLLMNLETLDAEEDIQIIYLGKCLEECAQMTHVEDNIYRAVAPSCCHAYAIKNSYAQRLMDDIDDCENSALFNCDYYNRGIDSIYGDYIIANSVNAIVIHPAVFFQDVLGGGSDLRTEYLHNYLECRDTTGTSSSEPQEQYYEDNSVDIRLGQIIGITIIGLGISLLLYFSVKKSKGSIFLFLPLVLIILGVVFVRKHAPGKIEDKPYVELSYPAIAKISSGITQFPIDITQKASKRYDTFNPNAIVFGSNIVASIRASNGPNSYPILQEMSPDLETPLFAKRLFLQSDLPIRNIHYSGFEDMRVFQYDGELYMIGVNLDRNIDNIPSMVMIKLDMNYENTGALNTDTWHLNYEPISTFPNKNWSPLTLPNSELGFIVDIDPLLIVKRIGNTNECEVAYSADFQNGIEKIRNSTITYAWSDIPGPYRSALEKFAGTVPANHSRYVLLGHVKRINDIVAYDQYFVTIDLENGGGHHRVRVSNPFHIEEEQLTKIEYLSGFLFINDELFITYGVEDNDSRFIKIEASELYEFIQHGRF